MEIQLAEFWTASPRIYGAGNGDSGGSLEIKDVYFSPETPKEGDTVMFQVKVYNNYTKDKNVKLSLVIDGLEVGSVDGSVSAGSTGEFSLHWSAEAGEHSYEVKLYRVEKGKEVLEDSESGKLNVEARCGDYWTAWLEVTPTEMRGEGKIHVKAVVSYCKPLPDVGGGTYPLLDFRGSVYLDGKEIHALDSVRDGTTLTVGATQVVDEFDWPLTVGTHNITLKIRNTSGLPQYETTKTDNVVVRVLPLEYPLTLVSASCSDLHFNFEASDYYTKGSYVSPLECTLSFENNVKTTIYIKELSADISVSPPDLKEAIPGHISIPINKNIGPGKIITTKIQDRVVTNDGQMLLRVDGTVITLHLEYKVDGIFSNINQILSQGVTLYNITVQADTKDVYLNAGIDGTIFAISLLKITKIEGVANKITTTTGVGVLLKFVNIPEISKNFLVSHDDEIVETLRNIWSTIWR